MRDAGEKVVVDGESFAARWAIFMALDLVAGTATFRS